MQGQRLNTLSEMKQHPMCTIDATWGHLMVTKMQSQVQHDLLMREAHSKLLVDFGFGFEAPYNVVELDGQSGDEPYEFAAVASIGALWILSRTPTIDAELLELSIPIGDPQLSS